MFWFNLPALSVHISAVPLEGLWLWMWHTTWMLNHQRIHVASFFPTSSLHPILRHHRACSVPATSSSSTFTTGCPPGFFYRLMMVTHQSSSPPHSLTLSAQHPADTPWAWTCKICTSESIHACTMHTCIWSLFTSNPKSQSFQIIKAGLSRPHAGPKRAKNTIVLFLSQSPSEAGNKRTSNLMIRPHLSFGQRARVCWARLMSALLNKQHTAARSQCL